VRVVGTTVNHVDLVTRRTKYDTDLAPPYMYFSGSSYVAKSMKPEVRVLEEVVDDIF